MPTMSTSRANHRDQNVATRRVGVPTIPTTLTAAAARSLARPSARAVPQQTPSTGAWPASDSVLGLVPNVSLSARTV